MKLVRQMVWVTGLMLYTVNCLFKQCENSIPCEYCQDYLGVKQTKCCLDENIYEKCFNAVSNNKDENIDSNAEDEEQILFLSKRWPQKPPFLGKRNLAQKLPFLKKRNLAHKPPFLGKRMKGQKPPFLGKRNNFQNEIQEESNFMHNNDQFEKK